MFGQSKIFKGQGILEKNRFVDLNTNGQLIFSVDKSIGVIDMIANKNDNTYSVRLNYNPIKAKYNGIVNLGDGLIILDGVFVVDNSNPSYRCISLDNEFCEGVLITPISGGGGGGGSSIEKFKADFMNPHPDLLGYDAEMYVTYLNGDDKILLVTGLCAFIPTITIPLGSILGSFRLPKNIQSSTSNFRFYYTTGLNKKSNCSYQFDITNTRIEISVINDDLTEAEIVTFSFTWTNTN